MQLKMIMENFRAHLKSKSLEEAANTVDDLYSNGYTILPQRGTRRDEVEFQLLDQEDKKLGFIRIVPIKSAGLFPSHEEEGRFVRSPFFQKAFEKYFQEMAPKLAPEWGFDLSKEEDMEEMKDELFYDFSADKFLDYIEGIDCLDAWTIGNVKVEDGWGPLMYDIAMEYATLKGSGLTPGDKIGSVSDDAFAVWNYYYKSRPDVEKIQLDDLFNTLTPTTKDNCSQRGSVEPRDGRPKFPDSPLNFVYAKKVDVLKKMEMLK